MKAINKPPLDLLNVTKIVMIILGKPESNWGDILKELATPR